MSIQDHNSLNLSYSFLLTDADDSWFKSKESTHNVIFGAGGGWTDPDSDWGD